MSQVTSDDLHHWLETAITQSVAENFWDPDTDCELVLEHGQLCFYMEERGGEEPGLIRVALGMTVDLSPAVDVPPRHLAEDLGEDDD